MTVGFLFTNTFEEKFLPSTVLAVKVSFVLFVVNEALFKALTGATEEKSKPAVIDAIDIRVSKELFNL